MKFNEHQIKCVLLSEISLKYEADTPEYLSELDDLISQVSRLKSTLRSGPDRHKHRKEMSRLQGAIEAIRFIKRKSERNMLRNLLSEGGKKVQNLPSGQRATLDPKIVTRAVTLYKQLIGEFNEYLSSMRMDRVIADRPVGSTYYYQEDLEQGSDVIYGDIDYLVIFPPVMEDSLGNMRREQAKIQRDYTAAFLAFLQSSPPQYVDVTLTGEVSPTMVVVDIGDGKKIQIDLIATIPKYKEWMLTRWVPERGVKGYIGGNLYKAFGDSLTLTLGAQGVLARTVDGKRVSSNTRGTKEKPVQFTQISVNPSTFFKDTVDYLAGEGATISDDLMSSPGMDPDNILISDIAKGIRRVAENLDANNSLPVSPSSGEQFNSSVEMLEEVLARFGLLIDASLAKKVKSMSDSDTHSEETNKKLNSLVKMNSEQYNNVKIEFGL